MSRLLCLFRIHDWHRMKWGGSLAPYPDLDCRECRRCGRFQIVSYWQWRDAPRARFDNIQELAS